jgi:hypothetical protein
MHCWAPAYVLGGAVVVVTSGDMLLMTQDGALTSAASAVAEGLRVAEPARIWQLAGRAHPSRDQDS